MEYLVYATFIAVVFIIPGSVQQETNVGCDINSGLGVADDMNYTVAAALDCFAGTINWEYPMGTLTVNFPRTVLPQLAHARRKMRVCFRGGVGQGVPFISQQVRRKNNIVVHEMKLVDSLTEWVCSKPSRRRAGIQVTLHSKSRSRPEFYLKAVHYRAEIVSPKLSDSGSRGNGHRKGNNDRRGQGRGSRQGIGNRRGSGRKKMLNRQF